MLKVFVVISSYQDDNSTIERVFSTEELALIWIRSKIATTSALYEVAEVEVDGYSQPIQEAIYS